MDYVSGIQNGTMWFYGCKFLNHWEHHSSELYQILRHHSVQFSSVQSLSHVWLFATPWIAARQASLSITNSWSSLRLMSIESVMPSSHLILCCSLLLLPPVLPSIRVFSNESTVCMRQPKYWSFSFSFSPSNEHPGSPLDTTAAAAAAAAAASLQSCPTLCDPIDSSPPGSPVPGILQAKTLEWVAISFSNVWKWKVKVKSLSHVRLLATPWTAAHQAPPSMGFSRQKYWSGVPLPNNNFRKQQTQVPMGRQKIRRILIGVRVN